MKHESEKLNGQLIIALSRSLQVIHRESEMLFRKNQLTMSQFTVLEALFHKGDLTIKELIACVLSTSGNMTVVVRNLEKQKLIQRAKNISDNRSYIIQLTSLGKTLIERIYHQHMELVDNKLSALSEQEKRNIIFVLKKLKEKGDL